MYALLCMEKLGAKAKRNQYQMELIRISEQKSRVTTLSKALEDGRVTGLELESALRAGADVNPLLAFEIDARTWEATNIGRCIADFEKKLPLYEANFPGQELSNNQIESYRESFVQARFEEHRKQMVEEFKQRLAAIEKAVDMEKERIELALKEEDAKIQAYDGAIGKEVAEQAPKFG